MNHLISILENRPTKGETPIESFYWGTRKRVRDDPTSIIIQTTSSLSDGDDVHDVVLSGDDDDGAFNDDDVDAAYITSDESDNGSIVSGSGAQPSVTGWPSVVGPSAENGTNDEITSDDSDIVACISSDGSDNESIASGSGSQPSANGWPPVGRSANNGTNSELITSHPSEEQINSPTIQSGKELNIYQMRQLLQAYLPYDAQPNWDDLYNAEHNAPDEVILHKFTELFGKETFYVDIDGVPRPVANKAVSIYELAKQELESAKTKCDTSNERNNLLKRVHARSQRCENLLQEVHDATLHKKLCIQAYRPKGSSNFSCYVYDETNWEEASNESIDEDFASIFPPEIVTFDGATGVPSLNMEKVVPIQQIASEQLYKMKKGRAKDRTVGSVLHSAKYAENKLRKLRDPLYQKRLLIGAFYPRDAQQTEGFWEERDKAWDEMERKAKTEPNALEKTFCDTFPEGCFHILGNGVLSCLPTDKTVSLRECASQPLRAATANVAKDRVHARRVSRVCNKAKEADENAKFFVSREDVESVDELYRRFWEAGNKVLDANGGPTHAEITKRCVCDMAALIRTVMKPTEEDIIVDPGCGYGTQGALLASLLGIRVLGYECDPERVRGSMVSYKQYLDNLAANQVPIRLAIFQMDIWQLISIDHATIVILNDEAFPQALVAFICNLIWKSKKVKWVVMFRPNKKKNDLPIEELGGLKFVQATKTYRKYGSGESSKAFLYQVVTNRPQELTEEHNRLVDDWTEDFKRFQSPFRSPPSPANDEHAWRKGMVDNETMRKKLLEPMWDPNSREAVLEKEYSLADRIVSVKRPRRQTSQ